MTIGTRELPKKEVPWKESAVIYRLESVLYVIHLFDPFEFDVRLAVISAGTIGSFIIQQLTTDKTSDLLCLKQVFRRQRRQLVSICEPIVHRGGRRGCVG